MKERQRRVDNIRRQSSETQNHLIDEYSAGKLSRREFIRRGTLMGASLSTDEFSRLGLQPRRRHHHHHAAGATTTAAAPEHHRRCDRHHRSGRGVDTSGSPSRPRPSGSTRF